MKKVSWKLPACEKWEEKALSVKVLYFRESFHSQPYYLQDFVWGCFSCVKIKTCVCQKKSSNIPERLPVYGLCISWPTRILLRSTRISNKTQLHKVVNFFSKQIEQCCFYKINICMFKNNTDYMLCHFPW